MKKQFQVVFISDFLIEAETEKEAEEKALQYLEGVELSGYIESITETN